MSFIKQEYIRTQIQKKTKLLFILFIACILLFISVSCSKSTQYNKHIKSDSTKSVISSSNNNNIKKAKQNNFLKIKLSGKTILINENNLEYAQFQGMSREDEQKVLNAVSGIWKIDKFDSFPHDMYHDGKEVLADVAKYKPSVEKNIPDVKFEIDPYQSEEYNISLWDNPDNPNEEYDIQTLTTWFGGNDEKEVCTMPAVYIETFIPTLKTSINPKTLWDKEVKSQVDDTHNIFRKITDYLYKQVPELNDYDKYISKKSNGNARSYIDYGYTKEPTLKKVYDTDGKYLGNFYLIDFGEQWSDHFM